MGKLNKNSNPFPLLVTLCCSIVVICKAEVSDKGDVFVQRPFSTPPTLSPPPYFISGKHCQPQNARENWEGNLCGDLSIGELPVSPFGPEQFAEEGGYPFDIIKNKTLQFFRHALPILKTYKALPKVARYGHPHSSSSSSAAPSTKNRSKRALLENQEQGRRFGYERWRVKRTQDSHGLKTPHESTSYGKLCENAVFCKLLNNMRGLQHRLMSPRVAPKATDMDHHVAMETTAVMEQMQPQTPCPSAAEYVTPVFARNHEGAWRYVVQIPREGYFTQTVEVTKCLQSSCNLIQQGSCRTSPRWQSFLVAEMFYPDAKFPFDLKNPAGKAKRSSSGMDGKASYRTGKFTMEKAPRGSDGNAAEKSGSKCDGYDDIGCYQFRLFYDWFLVPGECKCWKSSLNNSIFGK